MSARQRDDAREVVLVMSNAIQRYRRLTIKILAVTSNENADVTRKIPKRFRRNRGNSENKVDHSKIPQGVAQRMPRRGWCAKNSRFDRQAREKFPIRLTCAGRRFRSRERTKKLSVVVACSRTEASNDTMALFGDELGAAPPESSRLRLLI